MSEPANTPPAPSVEAVAPTDSARAFKDRMHHIEAEHGKIVGLTGRQVEDALITNLNRLEVRKRERKDQPAVAAPTQVDHPEVEGVTVSEAEPLTPPTRPCNYCARCLLCKREARTKLIIQKAKQDPSTALTKLVWQLSNHAMSVAMKAGPYRGRNTRDMTRIFIHAIESICDQSVKHLGPWR